VVEGVTYTEEITVADTDVVSVVNMKDVEPEVIVVVSGVESAEVLVTVTLALDEVSAASLMEIESLLSMPPTCAVGHFE